MYKLLLCLLTLIPILATAQESVSFSGTVRDSSGTPLAGATVSLQPGKAATITNEQGLFTLVNVQPGNYQLLVSLVGFVLRSVPVSLQTGRPNAMQVVLDRSAIQLEGVIVTAQKRPQQAKDVPAAVTVLDAKFLERSNIRDLDMLSGFVPGLNIQVQSTNRPGFVIRGLTSDDASAGAQSRVSVYFNNVPASRPIGSVLEVYDMAAVEVLKGPQGTLFGKGSLAGAVHFIPNKPVDKTTGSLSVGFGNYNQQIYTAVFNTPIVGNKLLMRVAGTFSNRDGYVKNTFGGTLNGKHTVASRFSLSYLAGKYTSIDYLLNYQDDNAPGTAFISKTYPNQKGAIDPFVYETSLEQGKALNTGKYILDNILTIRHTLSSSFELTSISSYRKNNGNEHFDGDGSAARALDVVQYTRVKQFYQELRLTMKTGNRFTGFGGVSFWTEKVHDISTLYPDERSFVWLRIDKNKMIDANGNPVLMYRVPNNPTYGAAANQLLPTDHSEATISDARNSSLEFFVDGTYKVTSKLEVSGGVRYVRDFLELENAQTYAGSASIVGILTKNYPSVVYKPRDLVTHSTDYGVLLGRVVFKYAINRQMNLYGGYSKGRRSKLIQFNPNNTASVLAAEMLNSFDLGLKGTSGQRLSFDANIFYSLYNNFQTRSYMSDTATGQYLLVNRDGGKATSYGGEFSFRFAVSRALQVYGNYGYLHARFSDNDNDGNKQQLAGNRFRLTPDHTLTVGVDLNAPVSSQLNLFVRPSYTYRSHQFFEDTNNPGIEQDEYGIANARVGLVIKKYQLEVGLFMNNIFSQNYLMDAGNSGQTFNIPTFVAGAPRMFGGTVSWKF